VTSSSPRPQPTALRRVVVTGAAGFIGSHLVDTLLDAGTTVIAVDNRDYTHPSARANLAPLHGRPGYHPITADLRTCAIQPLLLEADAVIHLAGIPGVRPSWGPQFSEYVDSNIIASQRLMDAATATRVPRVVVASSSSIYGVTTGAASLETDHPRPASPYAVTKLAEEQLCLAHAARFDSPTDVVALRYFTVYGPRQRPDMFIHRALHAAVTGEPLRLYGDGNQRRDFTFVDDVVTATIAAATEPGARGAINIGGGTNASLHEVIDLAEKLTDRPIDLHATTTRDGDIPTTRADRLRARTLLDWRPTVDLETGMSHQLQTITRQDQPVTA
jgi:nucleoside-diphosphate-sugar epimerase